MLHIEELHPQTQSDPTLQTFPLSDHNTLPGRSKARFQNRNPSQLKGETHRRHSGLPLMFSKIKKGK